MSGFLSIWMAELRSKVPPVLWVILSSVVAVSGPFGSYDRFDLVQRGLFWAPIVGLGVLVSSAMRTFVAYRLRPSDQRVALIVTSALVCLVLCPPLYFLITAVFDDLRSGLPRFGEIVLLVATVSMGATALRQSLVPAVAPEAAPVLEAGRDRPRLLQRIDGTECATLLAISVRDHYVEVHTALGMTSLLMRFGDAIADASPVDGVQVHRSHWVAWAAIEAVERDGVKLALRLSNGLRVPVSKGHRDKLQQRGLL